MNFATSSYGIESFAVGQIKRVNFKDQGQKQIKYGGSRDLEINIINGCTEYILYVTKNDLISFDFKQFLTKYKNISAPVIKEYLSKALFNIFIEDKNVIYIGFDSEKQTFIGANIINKLEYINFQMKGSVTICGGYSKIIKVCITEELISKYYASLQPMWKKNDQWRLYMPCNIEWWHYRPIYSNEFYCLDVPYEKNGDYETSLIDHHKNIKAYKDIKKIIQDYEYSLKQQEIAEWDFVSE